LKKDKVNLETELKFDKENKIHYEEEKQYLLSQLQQL
jgi:hypothetical protein